MDKTALDELLRLPKPRYEAELPLDRIDLNPYQPRDPIGEEDVEGMTTIPAMVYPELAPGKVYPVRSSSRRRFTLIRQII